MSSMGLWMLATLAVLILSTGLPVWALLIGTASVFALAGVTGDSIHPLLLGSMAGRLTGLLENDLLQAMPLYVLVGLLLQRLSVVDALYALFARMFRFTGAAPSLAVMGIAAWVAPLNGSVASSASLLGSHARQRLGHLPASRALALASAASSIGVVVPPSLVLLLLGDAMLRAHTEASNLPGFVWGSLHRIVNTQDVLRAALLPAILVFGGWLLVAWWQGRSPRNESGRQPALRIKDAALALAYMLLIGSLLAGVFAGLIRAVEGAAAACCLLLCWTLLRRELDLPQWRALLQDALELSGSLFALLVGATTFSLVFRAWGTDQWLASLAVTSPLGQLATSLLILAFMAACALVLDAFEMIFVVIPILAPVLVLHLADAQLAAVLILLVLQVSFLVPPMGYAVLMARAQGRFGAMPRMALLHALWPWLLVPFLVVTLLMLCPQILHLLDPRAPATRTAQLLMPLIHIPHHASG